MAIGLPHPDYLFAKLTKEQWAEWIAYNQLEPIESAERSDVRSAIQTLFLRQAWIEEDRTIQDFMPKFEGADEALTEADIELKEQVERDQFR